MMMKSKCFGGVLVVVVLFASACSTLDNTVLFTKTNVGAELSTAPPTVAADISRTEGVITRQFDEGKAVPVLASFKNAQRMFPFDGALGSAFATGSAAVTLATLYDLNGTGRPCDGGVTLVKMPARAASERNVSHALVFTTRTVLGLSASWSAEIAAVPDANFGYNRREFALLPMMYSANATARDANPGCPKGATRNRPAVDVASILATISADYAVRNEPGGDSSDTSRIAQLQYFATGTAATQLATQPAVREAMIRRLDPTSGFRLQLRHLPAIATFYDILADIGTGDPIAEAIKARVDQLRFNVPGALPTHLVTYSVNPAIPKIEVLRNNPLSTRNGGFQDMLAYVGQLESLLTAANEAVALATKEAEKTPPSTVEFAGGPAPGNRVPAPADRERLATDQQALSSELLARRQVFFNDPDVIQAYTYVARTISP